MNRRITDHSLDAMTTAAVVAYHTQEYLARVSYAGHPPILFQRKDEKTWSYAWPAGREGRSGPIKKSIPLAIDFNAHYEEFTIPMHPGDRLLVYTDGIIDTPNPDGESFGLDRLKDVLDANAAKSLPELKSAVLQALYHFALKELTHDDLTLIAMEIC